MVVFLQPTILSSLVMNFNKKKTEVVSNKPQIKKHLFI